MTSWNERVIAEFRANDGVTKGWGKSLLVMHTIGAKSEEVRLAPVMGLRVPDGWLVVASKGGAPANPSWYYNLMAHPEIEIEAHVDGEISTVPVIARELSADEYPDAWEKFVAKSSVFADYADKAERHLPIITLTRR